MSPCGRRAVIGSQASQLRLGDGSWSPDHSDGPCGLTIDLKREKKRRQLLSSGFAAAERTDLPAGSYLPLNG